MAQAALINKSILLGEVEVVASWATDRLGMRI
jgi:hypothetical protein